MAHFNSKLITILTLLVGIQLVISISEDQKLPVPECERMHQPTVVHRLGTKSCVYIKSVLLGEYLYAPDRPDGRVFTKGRGLNGHPCTWAISQTSHGRIKENQALWKITSLINGKYTIETVSGRLGYLSANRTDPSDSQRLIAVSENTNDYKWQIESSAGVGLTRIKHASFNEYLYVDEDCVNNENLRSVFTWVGETDVENWCGQADWILEYTECPLDLTGPECDRMRQHSVPQRIGSTPSCAYIKNIRFDEYLYAPDTIDLQVFTRRDKSLGHPCTWGKQSPIAQPVENEALWRIAPYKKGTSMIQTVSGRLRYLYANTTNPSNSRRVMGLSENPQSDNMEWIIKPDIGDAGLIRRLKNKAFNEYFYAADEDWVYDEKLRNVFTWVGANDVENWDGQGDWIFEYAPCP